MDENGVEPLNSSVLGYPTSPQQPAVLPGLADGSHSEERPNLRPSWSRRASLPRDLPSSNSGSIFGPPPRSSTIDSSVEPVVASGDCFRQREPTTTAPLASLPSLLPPIYSSGHREETLQPTGSAALIARVEKDADDPSTPLGATKYRNESTIVTSLSKLFAAQSSISPEASRASSYMRPIRELSNYSRSLFSTETAALPDHVYNRGFLEGRHSDIIINAFGQRYKLHRLILDRAPFFRSALSEPWLEANASETTLHPEDIDPSITRASFELALKRLYGCSSVREEESEAVGLFATGCWLEMQDLVDSSIETILRQMVPENLSPLIKLVTTSYYGRSGDKIISSAKSMLCRDGWRMPIRFWDDIPGDVVREIVGGDGFFIDGEWDRWVLAKKLLDRRIKKYACDAGLMEPGNTGKVRKPPESVLLTALRFDGKYRRNRVPTGKTIPSRVQPWVSIYTHADVEPLLVLLDEGIHYVHLDFEQLQFIRGAKDVLGVPVLPERVISNALWQQMELRQRVMNISESEEELGISVRCNEDVFNTAADSTTTSTIGSASKDIPTSLPDRVPDEREEGSSVDSDHGGWDGNSQTRKFWIPSSDCNIVMGGNAEPTIATSYRTTLQRQVNQSVSAVQLENMQWASDFTAATALPRNGSRTGESGVGSDDNNAVGETRYTRFPPFRFAAEFPNPRLLKEKKRVYSRTVFYAGSLWNIYIQKVASSRSKQLGVYLHRAKEQETEEVIAGTAGLAQGSVDERIGQLEREMIMNAERNERRQRRRTLSGTYDNDGVERSGSVGENNTVAADATDLNATTSRSSTLPSLLLQSNGTSIVQTGVPRSSEHTRAMGEELSTPESQSESENDDNDFQRLAASRPFHIPTLPPYVDIRPTIKTYFKIYSPSRGGRMLSVYESAPDTFNFSQSWGWKSSTLMLDEGLLGGIEEADTAPAEGLAALRGRGDGDGKLRFMVVIGNI